MKKTIISARHRPGIMNSPSGDRQGMTGVIIAVIVVLIVIVGLLMAFFIPLRTVEINEARQTALPSGIEALNISLDVDVGEIDVQFVDDPTTAVALNVTGQHRTSLMSSREPASVKWEESINGSTLSVESTIRVGGSVGPYFANDVECVLLVSDRVGISLTILNEVGGIEVITSDGANVTSMNLRATTGGVRLTMANNVSLNGALNMKTNTGGVDLAWDNVRTYGNARIDMGAAIGGVRAKVTQTEELGGNVPFSASASVGGVSLDLYIKGNTSANLTASTGLGGVSIHDGTGFDSTNNYITSENYVTDSNFDIDLNGSVGGIDMRLRYEG